MKTREQMIGALRCQVLALVAVIVVLVAVIIALLALKVGAVEARPTVAVEWGYGSAVREPAATEATPAIPLTGAPAIRPEPNAEPSATAMVAEDKPREISLGEFKLYAYCPCSKCCGKWSGGPTASGVMPQAGRTVAVDPDVIPLGSLVIIGGVSYVAEDTGAGIEGETVDIYFDSHGAALEFGVQYAEVWLVEE